MEKKTPDSTIRTALANQWVCLMRRYCLSARISSEVISPALGLSEGKEPPALAAEAQRVHAASVLLDRSVDPVAWAEEHLVNKKDRIVHTV